MLGEREKFSHSHNICSPSLSLSSQKAEKKLLVRSIFLNVPCNTPSLPPIPSVARKKRVSLRDFVVVSSSLGTKAIALSFAIADQRQQFEFFALLILLLLLSRCSSRFPCRYLPLLLLFAWSTRSGLTHLRELASVPASGSSRGEREREWVFNKYQSVWERERERKNERVFPFEFCSLLRRRANDMKEKETQTRTDDGVAALLLALLPFRERVLFSLLVSSSIFFVPARARGTHAHTHKGAHENGAKAGIENSSFPRKIAGYLGCEFQIQKKTLSCSLSAPKCSLSVLVLKRRKNTR